MTTLETHPNTVRPEPGDLPMDLPEGVTLTPTGAEFAPDLTLDEWSAIGPPLLLAARASLWWVGDWIRYAERRQDRPEWGKKYLAAVELTGLAPNTLANAVWVSGEIETSRRRENLSWSHHRAVAPLDIDAQEAVLTAAAAHQWTRNDIRNAVKQIRATEDGTPTPQPRTARCAHPGCTQPEIEGAPLPACETHGKAFADWWAHRPT